MHIWCVIASTFSVYSLTQLEGVNEPVLLQVFVGNDTGRVRPHGFYQACRVTGRNTTACKEVDIEGTTVIEVPLDPSTGMTIAYVTVVISLRLKGKLSFPLNKKKLIFKYIISLTKNALEHVHLEDCSFRISCLSQVDWLDFLLIHSRTRVTVHLPLEAQRPSTSMGLHRTAFFSASKVDGHWIMLRLCPFHGRSVSLGVIRGGGWPGCWASALWLEGLRKTDLLFDWQRFYTIKRLLSGKTNCNLFLDICLAKLLDNFHRTSHTLIHTIPCFSFT